jgi:hypothetical protein
MIVAARRGQAKSRAAVVLPLATGFALTHALAFGLRSPVLLGLAALWLIPVPILLARRVGRPFDPLEPIWIFGSIFFFEYAVVPGIQLTRPASFQTLPGFMTLSPPHYYVAAWLGGAAFLVFCLVYTWQPVSSDRILGQLGDARSGVRALALTSGVLVAAGVLALELNLHLAHASAYPLHALFTGQLRGPLVQSEQGRGYINLGYSAFSAGLVCLALAVAIWSKRDSRRRRWLWLYFALAALATVIVFALLLGSRSLAAGTLVGLLVVFNYRYRRIPRALVLAALGAVALGAVVFISLRDSHHVTFNVISMAAYVSKTFDGFNFLVTALARVHHLLWGQSLGQDALYTYLPRALFHAKPTVYGIVLAQDTVIPGLSHSLVSGTYPPGILAEGYVNFGVLGVLALPALGAILLRLSYDFLMESRNPIPVVVFGYLLGNPDGFFRGLGPVVPAVVALILMLLGLQLPDRLLTPRRLTTAGVAIIVAVCAGTVAFAIPG